MLELADAPAAVDQLMGAVGLVQREGLMDERLELVGPYRGQTCASSSPMICALSSALQGRADVGEALGQHRGEVELLGRALHHADLRDAAVHGGGLEIDARFTFDSDVIVVVDPTQIIEAPKVTGQ